MSEPKNVYKTYWEGLKVEDFLMALNKSLAEAGLPLVKLAETPEEEQPTITVLLSPLFPKSQNKGKIPP